MSSIPKNVCGIDRAARVVVGLLIIAFGIFKLFGGGPWGYIIIVVGIIMFATGAVGRCGLYVPFGISTCPKDKTGDRTT